MKLPLARLLVEEILLRQRLGSGGSRLEKPCRVLAALTLAYA